MRNGIAQYNVLALLVSRNRTGTLRLYLKSANYFSRASGEVLACVCCKASSSTSTYLSVVSSRAWPSTAFR